MMRAFAAICLLLTALPAAALENVALQLNWKHQFQFAGYYAAIEKGYYREAGFAVRVIEADEKNDPIDAVLKGRAEFGIGASELALRRARGEPVVALATILQHSPLVLLARKTHGSQNLHDLAGKRIMLMPHETELYAYLKREHVATYQALPHTFQTRDLIEGRTEALSGYVTDEPFLLQQARFPYAAFSPRASGIDFYGDTLFTTEAQTLGRPGRVAAFRDASLRGWRYAMDHPAEIADLILAKYSQRHTRPHLLFEAEEMARLMRIDLIDIGHMLPGRWQHIAETYAELGMIPGDFSIRGLIWTPGPRELPPWVVPAFLAGSLFLVLAGTAAWWTMRLNRRLAGEIAERTAAQHELLATQRNTAALLDATQSLAMLIDRDGTILSINTAGAARFQGTPASVVGRDIYELTSPELRSSRKQAVERAVADESVLVLEDMRADRHLRNTIVPVVDTDAKIHRIAVFSEDITERKHAEDQLRAANERLQAQIDEIQRLQAALHEQVVRDGLTGLYNRRYLDETLPREIARAKREGHPLALVMIDVDRFKQLNDTYGHQAGDQVLIALGALLREDTRTEDLPCRYGGEEFVVLMPRMTLELARERADHWRSRFAELTIRHGELTMQTTISLGIAAYPNHGHGADELAQCADLALYLAKHDGRNRVVVFEVAPLTIDV
ncbi:MAG: diguanylate cyclase [Rhodocyclaceae bacterium]|nr:diguanylate cyclase [Rhodocyclaceae bacterium]